MILVEEMCNEYFRSGAGENYDHHILIIVWDLYHIMELLLDLNRGEKPLN